MKSVFYYRIKSNMNKIQKLNAPKGNLSNMIISPYHASSL